MFDEDRPCAVLERGAAMYGRKQPDWKTTDLGEMHGVHIEKQKKRVFRGSRFF